jgi:hypothetical protein
MHVVHHNDSAVIFKSLPMRTSKEKQAAVYYFSLCLLVIWNTVFSSAIDSDIYIVMYVPLIVNIVMKNIYNIK